MTSKISIADCTVFVDDDLVLAIDPTGKKKTPLLMDFEAGRIFLDESHKYVLMADNIQAKAPVRLQFVHDDIYENDDDLKTYWIFTRSQSNTFSIAPVLSPTLRIDIYDEEKPDFHLWKANNTVNQLFTEDKVHKQTNKKKQKTGKEEVEEKIQLECFSLNVAWHNKDQNLKVIVAQLATASYDIICLQEVNNFMANLAKKNLDDEYYSYVAPECVHHHDTAFFIHKKTFANVKFSVYPLAGNKRRHVVCAKCTTISGQIVVVTTAHMESKFFDKTALDFKKKQLLQISEILHNNPSARIAFHMGDTNLTGDDWLKKENTAIQDAGLVDMAPILVDGFDIKEDQNSDRFKYQDATWRSGPGDKRANSTIQEIGGEEYTEFHRPDRILMTIESIPNISPDSTVQIIKDQLSDHDSLLFTLRFRKYD